MNMGRFRHPLKLAKVKKERLAVLLSTQPQWKVAEELGVSQMTICRMAKRLGLESNGRARANKLKGPAHSELMKEKYRTGELSAYWKGKKVPEEIIELRVSKLRGKPAWNSGKKTEKVSVCKTCSIEFKHSPKRNQSFCSKVCASVHLSKLNSDGRLKGNKNPNFGNPKVKEKWRAGAYSHVKIPKHGRGKTGRYKGVFMRSSWEIEYAKFLDENLIVWEYEPRRFRLEDGRTYTPDFYLSEIDHYVEVKGWWTSTAREKFNLFREQYPEVKISTQEDKSWKLPQ